VLAPGVSWTVCAPRWQVEPILLLNETRDSDSGFQIFPDADPSSDFFMRILPPLDLITAFRNPEY
jgi:hypothetical protein